MADFQFITPQKPILQIIWLNSCMILDCRQFLFLKDTHMQCYAWQNWKQVKAHVGFIVLVKQICPAIYKTTQVKQNVCDKTAIRSSYLHKEIFLYF